MCSRPDLIRRHADARMTSHPSSPLVRRVLPGENFLKAHRSHVYQELVRWGWSHCSVTIVSILLTVALSTIAWLGGVRPAFVSSAVGSALLLVLLVLGVGAWLRAAAGAGAHT